MNPDFDDLVGGDLEPGERARLERVHDLLVAAGPPPEPVAEVVELRPRRRGGALLAIAAALAVASFAVGAAAVDRWSGPNVDFTETMTGTASATQATGSLVVFDIDTAGNWPMELTVHGLPPAPGGKTFELWLTRGGKLRALCGSFLTDADGSAMVPLNAPYRFAEYDGWVVVENGSDTPLLTT
jgi:Anti-sigma-K factor rskA, C-terminal